MSEKINDLKKAMKEILKTPIFVLRSYENPKNLSPTLKEIFTRYNISEIKIKKFIEFLKACLKAEGKNFNSNSNLRTIYRNNLSGFIIAFICNVFDINDPNEILNIQQQIISELRSQTFNNLYFSLMPPELKEQLVNYTKNWLFIQLFMIDAYKAANVLAIILIKLSIRRQLFSFANFGQNSELGFIFGDRQERNLFNIVEIHGHNLPENPYSPLSDLESVEADVETEDLNSFNKNEPNRNQTIEQQIKQFKSDVTSHSIMHIDPNPNFIKLSILIGTLNDMRDKLSEIFSQQAIKNVINFLKDILKNNNKEIISVCNIIHEFDEINPISVVHFLNNFSKHYPKIMNENFDFEKLVDFIDNELLKKSINCWDSVLNIYDFYNLMEAVEWNFSLLQYKYLAKNFLSEIEKISNKSIEEIIELVRTIYVTQILNQNDLKELRNKLIIPGKDYPMERTQDDLKREKIAKCNNELLKLLQCQSKILSNKEYKCISDFFAFIVNNNETEKINHVCSLIFNSLNGIDRTLVDSLLELASLFQLKKIFHIPSQCRNNVIMFWMFQYNGYKKNLSRIKLSSKFQPILNLAEALSNYWVKLLNYFSNEQIINFINFIGDICEKNNIDEINSIINMIQEFNDINNISSVIHFLHNFSRRYPEVMGTEPIPKSEIAEPENRTLKIKHIK